jgi:hypothetical protein
MKQTHRIFEFASKNNIFYRTFPDDPNSSGLVTLDIVGLQIRKKILEIWNLKFNRISQNIFQIDSPVLTPYSVLKTSKHLEKFTDQNNELIFTSKNLILRPETCQAIFSNFRRLKLKVKESEFGICHFGKSFRFQKTSEVSLLRLKEFEQLELEFFTPKFKSLDHTLKFKTYDQKTDSFKDSVLLQEIAFRYIPRLIQLVMLLGFSKDQLYLQQVDPKDLPHYSVRTIDLYGKIQGEYVELASINYRLDLSDNYLIDYSIFEISLGVHRLIWAISEKAYNKNPNILTLPPIFVNTCIIYNSKLPSELVGKNYIYLPYKESYKPILSKINPLKNLKIILIYNNKISKLDYNLKINFQDLDSKQGLNILNEI